MAKTLFQDIHWLLNALCGAIVEEDAIIGELPRAHNLDIDKISAIYQFVTAMPMLFVSTTHTHGKGVDKKRKRSID